jgi:hypothetical protein
MKARNINNVKNVKKYQSLSAWMEIKEIEYIKYPCLKGYTHIRVYRDSISNKITAKAVVL